MPNLLNEMAAKLRKDIETAFEQRKPHNREQANTIAAEIAGYDWEYHVMEVFGTPRFHIAIGCYNPRQKEERPIDWPADYYP